MNAYACVNRNYLVHSIAAILTIYFVVILKPTRGTRSILDTSCGNLGRTIMNWFVLALALLLLVQFKFRSIVQDAQACAKPTGGNVIWSDKTKKWYRDAPFFVLFFLALCYGLCVFASGSAFFYDPNSILPSPENRAAHVLLRVILILPLAASLYYIWKVVVEKLQLLKPVSSRLLWFERPLAAFFAIVWLFLIPYVVSPSAHAGVTPPSSKIYSFANKLVTCRLLPAISLFGAIYVLVWRLQGGLFLPKQLAESLKEQLKQGGGS